MQTAVGNDVVDLGDPVIARHHERERFVSRVCSPGERAFATTPLGLWSLFAAKEAAYKALVKLGHAPGFAHREIVVAQGLREVGWHGFRLRLIVAADAERVHAVAWGPSRRVPLMSVALARNEEEGRAARSLLCELVAGAIGCSPSELEVVRDPMEGAWDGLGPPRVERRGARIDADVSLSHDGRFVAAAVYPPPPRSRRA